MKELYKPIQIPNLIKFQQELLGAIDHDYTNITTNSAFTYSIHHMQKKCPEFMNWLLSKSKISIRLLRYYITPPHSSAAAHIDGIDPRLPFGLNIPLSGTRNTYHTYYDTTEDNLTEFSSETKVRGFYGAMIPKDISKLTILEELELIEPHVINNEVLHGIRNDSDEFRVMFTVRWAVHHTMWRNIEEVIDTTGLFNE